MLVRKTLIGDALRRVAALLPVGWSIDTRADNRVSGARHDAVVDLTAPSGEQVSFAVEVKRSGSVPIPLLLTALREFTRTSRTPVMFVSDYIGPSLRAALADQGVSFADATGWVRLASENPLVLLSGQGAERSPRPRRSSALVRLNGIAASRTIRALTATSPPIGVRDLADLADVSPGSVSKLLSTLSAEGIVDRDGRGGIAGVRRRALIQRWVRDYAFAKANKSIGYYIAPRGLERTLSRVNGLDVAIALTGSAAARRLLPETTTSVVPLRLLAMYAAEPDTVAGELGCIDAEPATANVMVAIPQDAQVLSVSEIDTPLAPTALVLADLLTLPNRSDAEAEQLIDVLAYDDPTWKE